MKTIKLLNYIKEEKKIFHFLDRLVLVTFPFVFLIILYIVKQHIFHTEITKAFMVTSFAMLVLILIILQSRALGRDVKDVESLIIKEISPRLLKENKKLITWDKHKIQYIYIEAIPALLLLVIPIIVIKFPNKFFQNYFREAYVQLIIVYVFAFGLLRLISFKNYMNELIRTYHFLVQLGGEDVDKTVLMKYDFRRFIILAVVIGSAFFIISRYLLLANEKLVHIFLLALSISVLFILGKGLYDAHKGFYKSLAQIDELRKMIGIDD